MCISSVGYLSAICIMLEKYQMSVCCNIDVILKGEPMIPNLSYSCLIGTKNWEG